jgi:hypothetical protein
MNKHILTALAKNTKVLDQQPPVVLTLDGEHTADRGDWKSALTELGKNRFTGGAEHLKNLSRITTETRAIARCNVLRTHRRHAATMEFNSQVLSSLHEVMSRLDKIQGMEGVITSLSRKVDLMIKKADPPAQPVQVDELEKRISSMELLLFRIRLDDFDKIDAVIMANKLQPLAGNAGKSDSTGLSDNSGLEDKNDAYGMNGPHDMKNNGGMNGMRDMDDKCGMDGNDPRAGMNTALRFDIFDEEEHVMGAEVESTSCRIQLDSKATQTDQQGDLQAIAASCEAAIQVYVHHAVTSDQVAADVAAITDCGSHIGAWMTMSESDALKVGDFVKVDTETKSINPKIVIEQGLFGRVRNLSEDGDPYVFFPDADFHRLGHHWIDRGSLQRLHSSMM